MPINQYPNHFFHTIEAANKINGNLNYAYSPDAVETGIGLLPKTGHWVPLQTDGEGSLKVALTSGISIDSLNISGLVVNTDQLEVINTSGTQYLAAISGRLAGSSTVSENIYGVLGGTGFYSGLLFPLNLNRKEVFVQNISTVTPSYIRFGSQASAQSFSVILNPASTSGLAGGSLSNENYKGAVYFSGGSVTSFEV